MIIPIEFIAGAPLPLKIGMKPPADGVVGEAFRAHIANFYRCPNCHIILIFDEEPTDKICRNCGE